MNEKSQTFRSGVVAPPETRCAVRYPAWCDPDGCTADQAATTGDGYRAGAGGEQQSAPIPPRLGAASRLPARGGAASLTEARASWRCEPYLRVQVGGLHLFMPASLLPGTSPSGVTPCSFLRIFSSDVSGWHIDRRSAPRSTCNQWPPRDNRSGSVGRHPRPGCACSADHAPASRSRPTLPLRRREFSGLPSGSSLIAARRLPRRR